MFETKKFIFLSNRQRMMVSLLLGALLAISIVLLIASKYSLHDQEIKLLSIDIIKLTITAWGAWGLILLYASANSLKRIRHETKMFLEEDIPRAFESSTVDVGNSLIDPVNIGLKLKIVAETYNSTIYEFSNGSGFAIHFLCKLNVRDLAILIFLPEDHAANYLVIYHTSLTFLHENDAKVMFMGVFEEHWLPNQQKRMQIHIQRNVGDDFLFDAAKRLYFADSIFGDLRAFLVRAQREDRNRQIA